MSNEKKACENFMGVPLTPELENEIAESIFGGGFTGFTIHEDDEKEDPADFMNDGFYGIGIEKKEEDEPIFPLPQKKEEVKEERREWREPVMEQGWNGKEEERAFFTGLNPYGFIAMNGTAPKHSFKNGAKGFSDVENEKEVDWIIPVGYTAFKLEVKSKTYSEDEKTEIVNKLTKYGAVIYSDDLINGTGLVVLMKDSTHKKGIKEAFLTGGIKADVMPGGRNYHISIKTRYGTATIKKPQTAETLAESIFGSDLNPIFKAVKIEDKDRWNYNYMEQDLFERGFPYAKKENIEDYVEFLFRNHLKKSEAKEIVETIAKDFSRHVEVPKEAFEDKFYNELDGKVMDEEMERDNSGKIVLRKANNAWGCISYFDKEDNKYSHRRMVDILVSEFRLVAIGDMLFIYENGALKEAEDILEYRMNQLYQDITDNQRREVFKKLISNRKKGKTYIDLLRDENGEICSTKIACKNGIIDLSTGELLPHDNEWMDPNPIPWNYYPDAPVNEAIEKEFETFFSGDKESIQVAKEFIGCILRRDHRFQVCLYLIGRGSNGKSTFLDMVKRLLGEDNCDSKPLHAFGENQFSVYSLRGKLANLSGEQGSQYIDPKSASTFKALTGGDRVETQQKFKAQRSELLYTKSIFCSNYLPLSSDKSDGWNRRFLFLKADAKFGAGIKKDINIIDKLTTTEAMEYLLSICVKAVVELYERGEFAPCKWSEELKEEFINLNDNVLTWIDTEEKDRVFFMTTHNTDIYKEFKEWCKENGFVGVPSATNFYTIIRNRFNFDEKFKKSNSNRFFKPAALI